jgi:DNA polymerase-3 subunit gamma/tau
VPPAELLTYLDSVLKSEGYEAEDGVLPMVVRASGGSVRDALSLLDQLIAGSDSKKIAYERSINLLGFTHDNLMADVIEAFAELDAAKAFTAVDKIIQSGQDARRFLEDLLERIRDLMLVHSLGQDAKAILRGIGPEQFEQLTIQAARFGLGSLTQTAEATAKALSDTSAASNPRLQLELLCARVLAPAAKQTTKVISEPVAEASKPPVAEKKTESRPTEKSEPTVATKDVSASFFKANWQIILDTLAKQSRSAWAVAFTSKVIDYNNEVLTLLFQSQKDVEAFRNSGGAAEVLRSVIREMTGVSVKYRAKVADAPSKVSPAPVIESNQDDFSDEEEHEELKTEPIETADPRTGEFILREVLGAKPIKGEK